MKLGESFNRAPYHTFVNPLLCEKLRTNGLSLKTMYIWKVRDAVAELDTFLFDPDDYYGQASSLIHQVCPSKIIPAYDIMDMYVALPAGANNLVQINGYFEFELSGAYRLPAVRGSRLPDVLAEMVLQCMDRQLINIGMVNKKINAYVV